MIQRLLITVMLSLLTLTLSSAQQNRILIIEGNASIAQRLHPYSDSCTSPNCQRIVDLLFPRLLNIDPETDWLTPAEGTSGLVSAWEIDEDSVTYTLVDDRAWSDGRPITAYDVFFSYILARQTGSNRTLIRAETAAAVPLDENTFQVIFQEANCRTIPTVNFPIVPAPAGLADAIDYDGGDVVEWLRGFNFALFDFGSEPPQFLTPTATAGAYTVADRRFEQSIHLQSLDGEVGYSFIDTRRTDDVDFYLRGESNLLVEPPYLRRADLRADDTSLMHSYPGNRSVFIALNPMEIINEEPVAHRILSDPAVRQAMGYALDMDAIIDAAVEGDGIQLAGSMPPTAFGHNPDLHVIEYDVTEAQRKLYDAGWRDMDADGVLECLHCATAERGARLQLDLYYEATGPADTNAIVSLVRNQLFRVGIAVELIPTQGRTEANFDLRLVNGLETSDIRAVTSGLATGEIADLLERADNVTGCDAETRQALYQEAEALMHAEQTHLWLFSPNRMIATRLPGPPDTWEPFLP